MQTADVTLDARGLSCPMPILRTKQALSKMVSGQTLYVIATDPGSVKDFDAFCRATGNILQESREERGEFHYLLRKA